MTLPGECFAGVATRATHRENPNALPKDLITRGQIRADLNAGDRLAVGARECPHVRADVHDGDLSLGCYSKTGGDDGNNCVFHFVYSLVSV